MHEVTSPQAFEGLSRAGRKVRRLDGTLATVDHNVSVSSAPRRIHPGDRVADHEYPLCSPTSSRKNFKDSASFIKECVPAEKCSVPESEI